MIKLSDILSSFLSSDKRKTLYKQNVRNSLNNSSTDWDARSVGAAESVLAAICFRESSEYLFEQNNFIYPPIGYYYSMFHFSLALLKLDYSTDTELLKNIHHKKLINLVDSKLVTRKILSNDYIKNFRYLKDLREHCNYKFGYYDNLTIHIDRCSEITSNCFDEGLVFLHNVLEDTQTKFRFGTSIGDSFGEDIIDTYLSDEEKDRVWHYLTVNCLTT